MINNEELPIGFTMALAQRSDILNQFASLPDTRKQQIIEEARNVSSREEMRNFVEHLF